MTIPTVSAIERASAMLCESRLNRERFHRFPVDCVPSDEAAAYAIQDSLHRCLASRGWGGAVGYKIGCTTRVMQAYLGIPNPCAGGVFDTTIQQQAGQYHIPPALRVGVECEIAVVLRLDLLPTDAPFNHDKVARAVGSCMAAIEIVEDRYVDYPSLDTPTLISDDFFGAGCVLGKVVSGFSPLELGTVGATMWINGVAVGSGIGTDVLGHPLNALTWLANSLADRGRGLRSGEFVLLGSLVQTNWVQPGDDVLIRNDSLGEARVTFR